MAYLEQGSKGHTPKIKEPDIRRAFKMNKRAKKFSLDLSDVNAHTMKIMEIIDDQKARMENKKQEELEGMIQNGRR